jgi:hypothetical protein
MIFLFAANHRMKKDAIRLRDNLEQLGCQWIAVDLGGLGFGFEATVQDNTFQTLGYYRTKYSHHPSRSMHKPSVIQHILNPLPKGDILVYLDADVCLKETLIEVGLMDFDVAVTVRPEPNKFLTRYNAGVIFFRSSKDTMKFCQSWEKETVDCGNDEMGLQLAVEQFGSERILELPMDIYNFNYIPVPDIIIPAQAKVLHPAGCMNDNALKRIWEMRKAQG